MLVRLPLAEIATRAGPAPLAIVVFASEYRPSIQTPRRPRLRQDRCRPDRDRCAEYDGRQRGYVPTVEGDVHAVRVLPASYAPCLAMRVAGSEASFVPLRFRPASQEEPGDAARQFWLPLHKLFSGAECLRGLDLSVRLHASHVNEKLARIQLALGPEASCRSPDIDRHRSASRRHTSSGSGCCGL